MIKINLIDQGEKKGGKAPTPAAGGGGGGGGGGAAGVFVILLALGAFGAGNFVLFNQTKSKVDAARDALEATKKEVADFQAKINEKSEEAHKIRKLYEEVKIQSEILAALDPEDKVLWSEKLNMLAQAIPENVFLTNVNVKEKVTQVEIPSSIAARQEWEANNKEGPRPPVVKKPIVTYDMTLVGFATGESDHEQWQNVKTFNDVLVAHETTNAEGETRRFMHNFLPEIGVDNISIMLYEKQYPVTRFTFNLKTVAPKPPEEPKPAASATAAPKGKKKAPARKH